MMKLTEFRQTELKFEEIVRMLESRASSPPRCMLINELGIIALEDKNAEAKLRELLLTETGDSERCAAYGFLTLLEKPSPETLAAIDKFKADPENTGIVEQADETNISIRELVRG